MESDSFYLRPTPPFRLDLTVWALRRMPHNDLDRWDGSTYERLLVLDGNLVKLAVSQPGTDRIRVQAAATQVLPPRQRIVREIEALLGIRIDLSAFQRFASRTALIGPLARDFQGFKPPRFPTVYEAVINAVCCQQLSLIVCIVLLNRLAGTWGRTWSQAGSVIRAFPLPAELAGAGIPMMRRLGFSESKARTIITVSREVASGALDLGSLESRTDSEVMEVLRKLPGIGPWSAEYVMLRGLGRTHVFPGRDSGALRSLQSLLKLSEPPPPEKVLELARQWHPFGGLIYFHFLLNKLRQKEHLAA